MSEINNNAARSATDDFKAAAFSAGLSILNFGMAGLNALNDNSIVSLVCLFGAAVSGGAAVYRGLSGFTKLHEEARGAPHASQPPKIQP